MARVFNGSSQYLSASSTLLGDEPIDLIAALNSDSVATSQNPVNLGNNGGKGFFSIEMSGGAGGDPVRAVFENDAGTSYTIASSASYLALTWYNIAASFISNTSRAIFLNGTKSTDATSVSDPISPDFITIGALRKSTFGNYMDGSVSEVYILDANMTDAQHASAGKGVSPFWLVPGKNVRAWYPLQGHNNNRVRNGYPNLTATGSPTNGTHPARVLRPRINGVMAV